MAILEYLDNNRERKKINAYGVSSVNGQQGAVQVTPESIGAPTRDRVEKLNRELQKRLEKVEWKDVTEDFNNSEFSDEVLDFCLSLQEEGKYYILPYSLKVYCKIINIDNRIYHEIITYSDDGYYNYFLYINNSLTCQYSIPNSQYIELQTPLGLYYNPKESQDAVNKQYVDTEISKFPKVYIGSGEMPKDCDIQFDFDEEPPIEVLTPINLSNYTYTKEQIDTMFGEYVTDIDILIGGGAE